MTDTPEPTKPKKQRRRHMSRRTLVKILPEAATRIGALLHDEGEVGLTLEMGVICNGTTNTYLPAIKDILMTLVKEQQWEFVREVVGAWTEYSNGLVAPDGSQRKRLKCHIDLYVDTPYDPIDEGCLTLEVLPTRLRLRFAQYANAEVTIACPQRILDRILSGQ